MASSLHFGKISLPFQNCREGDRFEPTQMQSTARRVLLQDVELMPQH